MFKVDDLEVVEFGYLGEHDVTTVQIDVSAWEKKWPGLHYFIVALRSEDRKPYVASTSKEGNVITWTVTIGDTSKEGVGHAEVIAMDTDGTTKKSKVFRTVTDRSLSAPDVGADELLEGYLERLLRDATAILAGEIVVREDTAGEVSIVGGKAETVQKSTELHKLKLPGDTSYRDVRDVQARSDAAKGRSVQNILDNSYFGDIGMVVNQRRKTVYEGGAKYSVDRWAVPPASSVVTLYNKHLSVSNTGGWDSYIRQYIHRGAERLCGKTVTIAIKMADGQIYVGSGTIPTTLSTTSMITYARADFGVGTAQVVAREDPGVFVQIGSSTGKTFNIEWVALYEGAFTKETLPNYVCKGYEAEKQECMRHYQMITVIGGESIGGARRELVRLPVEMRANPSVTIVPREDTPNFAVDVISSWSRYINLDYRTSGAADIYLSAEKL